MKLGSPLCMLKVAAGVSTQVPAFPGRWRGDQEMIAIVPLLIPRVPVRLLGMVFQVEEARP